MTPLRLKRGERWRVVCGDSLQLLTDIPAASVDAIVTDPPYGLNFKGAAWDGKAIYGHDRSRSAPERFEAWVTAWATECLRVLKPGGHLAAFGATRLGHRLTCGIEDAGFEIRDQLIWLHAQGAPKSRHYTRGRATCLRPAYEPIVLARKPFDGQVADNLTRWGTGALNVDAARNDGRWPTNVALTHAADCTRERCREGCPVGMLNAEAVGRARYYFCAKANRRERDAGCQHLPASSISIFPSNGQHGQRPRPVRNTHPTVKPLELMRWLVRLIVPEDGLVLDPFTGSGTTGAAAVLEGRRFIGIERDLGFVTLSEARIAHWAQDAGDRHPFDRPKTRR